jgi:hypothetical protein
VKDENIFVRRGVATVAIASKLSLFDRENDDCPLDWMGL